MEGHDPTIRPDSPSEAPELKAEQFSKELLDDQNMSYAITGGSFVALIMAIIWALLAVATEYQIGWMAIGVGFFTGVSVKYFGRGITKAYGIVGAVLSLLGSIVGNALSIIGFIAKNNSLGTFQVLFQINFAFLAEAFIEAMSPMDFLFYALAAYEGYRISFMADKGSNVALNNLTGPVMDPKYIRFRFPLLVGGGMIVLCGIYGLQFLASGEVRNTYDSGNVSSKGMVKTGKLDGPWTYYHENGVVSAILHYKKGELDSTASWWNEKHQLIKKGRFWQGLEHGAWEMLDSSGAVQFQGSFVYGRQHGKWTYWHNNREKRLECFYRHGKLESTYVSWYANGQTFEQGSYEKDKRIGIWKMWDSSGFLRTETSFAGDTQLVLNCWDLKK